MTFHLKKHLLQRLPYSISVLILVFLYCEILHYVFVLLSCSWPSLDSNVQLLPHSVPADRLKVVVLGDTHLLGSREGHWFDRIRREWQMQQSFQTSMFIHNPDVVFVLGDLLDEGKWCSDEEFEYHVTRFKRMFSVAEGTKLHVLSGNHDEGFHYMMTPHKHQRFESAFNSPSVRMLDIRGHKFVLVNSMAMEGDGCSICSEAEKQLNKISTKLKMHKSCHQSNNANKECNRLTDLPYIKPVLLQHFPLFRKNDMECNTDDAMPLEEKTIPFIPGKDSLDMKSTKLLFSKLDPRFVISAHTHHGCYKLHANGVPEYTVPSFSWRNKHNPTFLLVHMDHNNFTISRCYMPDENTVVVLYILAGAFSLFTLVIPSFILTQTLILMSPSFISWKRRKHL